MVLMIGTLDGVHRWSMTPGDPIQPVLDFGDAVAVDTFPNVEGVLAATRTGLYRSTDQGDTWEDLAVPHSEVFSVVASPDGRRLYAGTHPAHLFVSTDVGQTWEELEALQDQPSRSTWHTPRHRDAAHVRTLAVHPEAPERVVAGIEVGGIHVSDDAGKTWIERRAGLEDRRDDDLQYDVHHVLMTGRDTFFVSCGYGFYRTRDAGASWTRLDGLLDHRYFHASIEHEDRLVVAAESFPPGPYGGDAIADGALFVSRDEGDTFGPVAYPGGPAEVVTALASVDGSLMAGTSRGRVLERDEERWSEIGQAPDWVRALAQG